MARLLLPRTLVPLRCGIVALAHLLAIAVLAIIAPTVAVAIVRALGGALSGAITVTITVAVSIPTAAVMSVVARKTLPARAFAIEIAAPVMAVPIAVEAKT